MVHGTPDYGGSAPKITTYKLDDHAELAARLGSIVSFERRGEILWLNDFAQGGKSYSTFGLGLGHETYLSCDGSLSGGICLNLQTGPNVNDYEGVEQYSFYPVDGGLGHEIWFTGGAGLGDFLMVNLLYTGSEMQQYILRYNRGSGKLYVYVSLGVYEEVGAPGETIDIYGGYNPVKLVFNSLTRKYVRALFAGKKYDLSAYGPFVMASLVNACMRTRIIAFTEIAAAITVSIDNWIMTQNEPVT